MRVRTHGLRPVFAPALVLGLALSAPAYAEATAKTEYPVCTKPVEKSESENAHAKYLSGRIDYDEGKYQSAIQNFRSAYEKDCTKHELLVIISRSYELDHNLPEAIRALEVYLERNPSSPDASTHRTKIATMKDKLAQQQKEAAAKPVPTSPPPSGDGNGAATNAPPPGAESQGGHTIYPWLVVGGGVVAAAVGVVLIATTPSIPENCNKDTEECNRLPGESDAAYKEDQEQAGRGKNQPVIGAVVVAGGGLMIVGGLLWHFLEPTGSKDSAKAKLQPTFAPGYGGLAFTGRF